MKHLKIINKELLKKLASFNEKQEKIISVVTK